MDFWAQQEQAKGRSFRLVVLYAVLVGSFSLLAAWIIDLAWISSLEAEPETFSFFTSRFWIIFLCFPAVIGLMTHFSPAKLSAGGRSVAEAMEGALVSPQTKDHGERRLLNVVEEMAIASGMPVPPVYILQQEGSINAFAAGATINDAVIGVTRGTVEYLNREELQAVIAHEFSHILNKDMRLNLRFAQLIFGLICLSEIGRIMLFRMRWTSSGNRNDRGRALVQLVALVCFLMGLLMAFMGKIIQAAITRQREFLADASSVQFTRTKALASALKKIGGLSEGSRVDHSPLVNNYSHFFFSRTGRSSLFSTHPSLKTRILRLDPDWDGTFITPETFIDDEPAAASPGKRFAFDREKGVAAPLVANSPYAATVAKGVIAGAILSAGEMPLEDKAFADEEALLLLRAASREPLDACCLILAFLLDDDPSIQSRQLASTSSPEQDAIRKYHRAFALVPGEELLPLVELAVPALKTLSGQQYSALREGMLRFINADEVFSFREWILFQLVESQVGAQHRVEQAETAVSQKLALKAGVTLLAALALLEPDEDKAQKAFDAGLQEMGVQARRLPEKVNVKALGLDMDRLRDASERFKEALMNGALKVAAYDRRLSSDEAMFLRMLSLCFDLSMPEEAYAEMLRTCGAAS